MVEHLLNHHAAKVNAKAFDGSTPLRVACVNGHSYVVRALIQNGADVNKPMRDASTCLMIAALHGQRQEVKLLIKTGADVNVRTGTDGRTALHYAAMGGDYLIVINLMRNGAEFGADEHGLTPIHMACMVTDTEILEYLLSNFKCSKSERIEATELLGAGYVISELDNPDLDQCCKQWVNAMQERYDNENQYVIHKSALTSPSLIYQKKEEAKSIEEVVKLVRNKNDAMFEAIMMQERILGDNTMLQPKTIATFLTSHGDNCNEKHDYVTGTAFWLKAIDIRKQADLSVSDDITKFAGLFETMEEQGYRIKEEMLWRVLKTCIDDIERECYRLTVYESVRRIRRAQQHIKDSTFFILFMFLKLLKVSENSEVKREKLHVHVTRFLRQFVVSDGGGTVLHVCCMGNEQVRNHYIRHTIDLPNVELVELLLECDADPNNMDYSGESALHKIAHTEDFDETRRHVMRDITRHLVTYGAHVDWRNRDGLTAQDVANVTIGYQLKKESRHAPLKCLAAQIVKEFVPNYHKLLPKLLAKFVNHH